MMKDWKRGFFWGWMIMFVGQLIGTFLLWWMGKLHVTWG